MISVDLDKDKAMRIFNLDEIDINPNLRPLNPTTLMEQLALVYAESETGPIMHAHKFIN